MAVQALLRCGGGIGTAVIRLLATHPNYVRYMIFELALWASVLILRYMVPVFLVICATVLARGLNRWRVMEDCPPLIRYLGRELREAVAVHRTLFWASLLVFLSAVGFVTGRWPMWVFMVVTVLAAVATRSSFRGSFQRAAS